MLHAGEVSLEPADRSITLSKIFKWYKQDFGPPEEMLPWLRQYLSPDKQQQLVAMLSDPGATNIKLVYKEYDWGLNSLD